MDGNGFILEAMDLKEQKMNRGQDTQVISCMAQENQCSNHTALQCHSRETAQFIEWLELEGALKII